MDDHLWNIKVLNWAQKLSQFYKNEKKNTFSLNFFFLLFFFLTTYTKLKIIKYTLVITLNVDKFTGKVYGTTIFLISQSWINACLGDRVDAEKFAICVLAAYMLPNFTALLLFHMTIGTLESGLNSALIFLVTKHVSMIFVSFIALTARITYDDAIINFLHVKHMTWKTMQTETLIFISRCTFFRVSEIC